MKKNNSGVKAGRTIGGKREKLETSSERILARKKIKRRKVSRICTISIIFLAVLGLTVVSVNSWLVPTVEEILSNDQEIEAEVTSETQMTTPTIEVVDEAMGGGNLSAKMSKWIAEAESDFKELGYKPAKAVLPSGKVREVDFYLEGINGYIKMNIDRGSGVSVEDADRMLRYLKQQGVAEFTYIDVRVEGKGYWK